VTDETLKCMIEKAFPLWETARWVEILDFARGVQKRVAREAAELCEKANQLDENDSGAAATGGALYARDAIRARFGLDPTTEEQPK